MDIKSTFMNGVTNEDIYVIQLEGDVGQIDNPHPNNKVKGGGGGLISKGQDLILHAQG